MRRRLARELALQSLYQMEMNEVSAREAIAHVVEEAQTEDEAQLTKEQDKIAAHDVTELVEGTISRKERIDELLMDYLKGYKMDRLSKVDREILRLATYEMVYREDVPPKVVVNEAIELAKHFGSEESGKFVNGVLGKMIKELDSIKAKSL
ncbi:transcription antitermination factor NusB [Paenibacillus sp. OAS669]|uniref:transcription antitermination factor NusB n=1 Tax=Paenibacillus sp. OAS669 TaxID=2663821 RepID=UPI00178B0919|nr:transcription antitermination factor NusB [Paenibacillus sp. OAS669]MBE1446106.1 N utilization substance protein B [Paenibacillus sp. OAS669]